MTTKVLGCHLRIFKQPSPLSQPSLAPAQAVTVPPVLPSKPLLPHQHHPQQTTTAITVTTITTTITTTTSTTTITTTTQPSQPWRRDNQAGVKGDVHLPETK